MCVSTQNVSFMNCKLPINVSPMLGKRGGTWGKGEVGETEGGKGEVHGGKRSLGKRRGGKSGENVSFGCTGPHTEAIYDPSAIVCI